MTSTQQLVVVEHADTGVLTLHVSTCSHIARSQYVHREPTALLLEHIDHVCKTCKPERP